jgi:beta-lactamase regulating signal transducer with metallopeptidase domain|uniref:Uncharacterized protein n=1 Tax=Bionectria ochroleuca TaxID=29856 RepID=A0A8H7K3F1_BIOOC
MSLSLQLPSHLLLLALSLSVGESSPVPEKPNDQSQNLTRNTGNLISVIGLIVAIIVIARNIFVSLTLRRRAQQERPNSRESSTTVGFVVRSQNRD